MGASREPPGTRQCLHKTQVPLSWGKKQVGEGDLTSVRDVRGEQGQCCLLLMEESIQRRIRHSHGIESK